MHLLLHPFTRECKKTQKKTKPHKNENAKNPKKRKSIFSRTKTHIFKNEDAKKKTKTKTQILGERCQLSNGEYCIGILEEVIEDTFHNFEEKLVSKHANILT